MQLHPAMTRRCTAVRICAALKNWRRLLVPEKSGIGATELEPSDYIGKTEESLHPSKVVLRDRRITLTVPVTRSTSSSYQVPASRKPCNDVIEGVILQRRCNGSGQWTGWSIAFPGKGHTLSRLYRKGTP